MSEFDAKKALREEIEGLANIRQTLQTQEYHAERQMSEAEAAYNALVKLRTYADGEYTRKVTALRKLENPESWA